MENLCLTRLLYCKDEIIASLIHSLLYKRDLNECYYWIFELYYSEIEIFPLLWKIYLDFYFELNPVFERHLRKRQVLWEGAKDVKHIAFVIKNLFHSKSTYNVFLLRQLCITCDCPKSIYRGRKPSWCLTYPSEFHNWLRSIDKNHFENIVYYTKYLLHTKNSKELFPTLIQYFACKMSAEVDEKIYSFLDSRKDKDDFHYLLAMILNLKQDISAIEIKNIFSLPSSKEIKWIHSLNDTSNIKSYNVLKEKRLFAIDSSIGSFHLSRENVGDVLDVLRLHWEYFAYNSPIWKRRLELYDYKLDEYNHKVIFNNDDHLELFYDDYGLEPDEQSFAIQNMSTRKIVPMCWNKSFISEDSIVCLSDNFRFIY